MTTPTTHNSPPTLPIWEVYSQRGRLLHRTTDEGVARHGLESWPQAWLLLRDGVEVESNQTRKTKPLPVTPR